MSVKEFWKLKKKKKTESCVTDYRNALLDIDLETHRKKTL